jgi:hypothetical protein
VEHGEERKKERRKKKEITYIYNINMTVTFITGIFLHIADNCRLRE